MRPLTPRMKAKLPLALLLLALLAAYIITVRVYGATIGKHHGGDCLDPRHLNDNYEYDESK